MPMEDKLNNLVTNLNVNNLVSDHDDLFRRFSSGLEDWAKTGIEPREADQDVRYFLDLQHKRLTERDIDLDLGIEGRSIVTSNKKLTAAMPFMNRFESVKFSKSMNNQPITRKVTYRRRGKLLYNKTRDAQIVQTILEPPEDQADYAEMTYVCDNCGFVTTVAELEAGCPSCSTRYKIGDLYPRVSNFWFVPDIGNKDMEGAKKVTIGTALAFIAIMNIGAVITGEWTPLILLGSLFLSPFLALFAYLLFSFFILGKVATLAAKEGALYFKGRGSKRKTSQALQEYDPAFTYEYFEGKTLSLLRAILFHPDIRTMPQYAGGDLPVWSKDVLDLQYRGVMTFESVREEGDNLEVVIAAHMLVTYERRNSVKEKAQTIRVRMIHKAGFLADPGFSVKKITCRNCGASFDATRERTCPFCRSDYDLSEQDWLVTDIS